MNARGPALVEQETSPDEIRELWERYRIALDDATVAGQSVDGRYVDAYSAGFLLAKIAIRAAGYRVACGESHRDAFRALTWVCGSRMRSFAEALNGARQRRNADLYDGSGIVDERDVEELLALVASFEEEVIDWIEGAHPELIE